MRAGVTQLPSGLSGRLLAYGTEDFYRVAVTGTAEHEASGLVLAGRRAVPIMRRLRWGRYPQPLVFDLRAWSSEVATVGAPFELPEPNGLVSVSADEWLSGVSSAGATAVLTPSKFVPHGAWDVLEAVIEAASHVTVPDVLTLVATDAAMLDEPYVGKLIEVVGQSELPVAFVFAAKDKPLAQRGRAAGLRRVVAGVPGCLILGTEVLSATDALTHGAGAAAIGVTGGLRRPSRPEDRGRGFAAAGVPGLFLRELWESRSPTVYADWYANSTSPWCDECGRVLDVFGRTASEKEAVLRHNVHAWLGVWSELCALHESERSLELAAELRDAFTRHLALRPAAGMSADELLRQLVELDDPMQRRTAPDGSWL